MKLEKIKQGELIEQICKEKSKSRPEGINTVAMLKFASSCLGLGPQQTMHTAERLYLSGYISYPRTESTAFPQGFPTDVIIKNLQRYEDKDISAHSQYLLKNNKIGQPKKGQDAGDHPPITPTEEVPHSLNGPEKGLYDYLAKMFLACHSGDCKYQHTKIRFSVAEEQFKFTANKTLDEGFTKIATWLKVGESGVDPKGFIVNNQVTVARIGYKPGQTTPPDYLTETELITLMDKHRIGTDASMATHINNISERAYVRVEGGRKLVPTDLGLSLVRGYKKIDSDLVAPQLRSNIENQVD